jgi:hypothetical protein
VFTDDLVALVNKFQLRHDAEQWPRRRCYYAGAIEGVFNVLDDIENECQQKCFAAGEVTGKLAAKSYCELMIDSGGNIDPVAWIREQVQFCGLNYETACDSAFQGVTDTYSNDQGSCRAFGAGSAYQEKWELSRTLLCAYENKPDNQGRDGHQHGCHCSHPGHHHWHCGHPG